MVGCRGQPKNGKEKTMKMICNLAIAATLSLGVSSAIGRDLIFNANTSDPIQQLAMENLIAEFEQAYPEIDVKFNLYEHEEFKTAMKTFLVTDVPDVITWGLGSRMKTFVDQGLFEDVSDVWRDEQLYGKMPAVVEASSVDNVQYGVPYAYYAWGFYYRQDVFDAAGIVGTPKTWEEFKQVGEKLKAINVTPVAIGTKELWPAAGWFDFLNLRINGRNFHAGLMSGQVKYTDARVRKVFDAWAELASNEFFLPHHPSYTFQEALPFMNSGDAAMYLIAPFVVSMFPEDVRNKIEWFPFPVIDESVGIYEDAPTDSFHIPVNAKNKDDARTFLKFASRADVQSRLAGTLDMLPPNMQGEVKDDRFAQGGFAQLSQAKSIMQFYDRDTKPEMAKIGMQGFQEFLVNPERIDEILEHIESERERIYGAL